jgi:Inhibitor of Apoptosis domain
MSSGGSEGSHGDKASPGRKVGHRWKKRLSVGAQTLAKTPELARLQKRRMDAKRALRATMREDEGLRLRTFTEAGLVESMLARESMTRRRSLRSLSDASELQDDGAEEAEEGDRVVRSHSDALDPSTSQEDVKTSLRDILETAATLQGNDNDTHNGDGDDGGDEGDSSTSAPVPSSSGESDSVYDGLSAGSVGTGGTPDGPLAVEIEKERAKTTWPHPQPTPQSLAATGFFFFPTLRKPDRAQCAHCSLSVVNWQVGC